ncbi:MAG: type II secretion system protein N [Pseudomonadota bacterium]
MRFALVIIFVVTFIVSGLMRLPLAVPLSFAELPFESRGITGTVWNGTIHGIVVEDEAVGDLGVRLKAVPLLLGRIEADADLRGSGIDVSGGVALSMRTIALENVNASIELERLRLRDTLGQRLRGTLDAQVQEVVFVGGDCRRASLSASTDALAESLGAFASRGFAISGEGRCEEGDLQLPMAGAGPDAEVEVMLTLSGDGEYSSTLAVIPQRTDLGLFLLNFGFRQEGDVFLTDRSGNVAESL